MTKHEQITAASGMAICRLEELPCSGSCEDNRRRGGDREPPQFEGGGSGCGLGYEDDRGCGDGQSKDAGDDLWAERAEAPPGRGENSSDGRSCAYSEKHD